MMATKNKLVARRFELRTFPVDIIWHLDGELHEGDILESHHRGDMLVTKVEGNNIRVLFRSPKKPRREIWDVDAVIEHGINGKYLHYGVGLPYTKHDIDYKEYDRRLKGAGI